MEEEENAAAQNPWRQGEDDFHDDDYYEEDFHDDELLLQHYFEI